MRRLPCQLIASVCQAILFCLAFGLSGTASAASGSAAAGGSSSTASATSEPAAKPAASGATKSVSAKAAKDGKDAKDEDSRSSKELASAYQRLSEQAEKATACIFDPKCLSSDRKVLQLMVQRRELLDRLAARA